MAYNIDQHGREIKIRRYITETTPTLRKNKNDLYFSDHFIERMAERHLYNDRGIIVGMLKYFMDHIYYHTSHTNRTYRIKFKTLQLVLSITDTTTKTHTGGRYVVVKTAYDNDTDYECDEVIELSRGGV